MRPALRRMRCELKFAGKTIAYSGDTEWTDALLDVASGADLFICEAYYLERKTRYHLDYATVMAHRARLGCRRLVLTHMSADMLRRVEQLEEEAAYDGMTIEL